MNTHKRLPFHASIGVAILALNVKDVDAGTRAKMLADMMETTIVPPAEVEPLMRTIDQKMGELKGAPADKIVSDISLALIAGRKALQVQMDDHLRAQNGKGDGHATTKQVIAGAKTKQGDGNRRNTTIADD